MINVFRNELSLIASHMPPPKICYFKVKPGEYAEHDQFLNVPVPKIRALLPKYKDMSLDDLSELINSPYNEERLSALLLLIFKVDKKLIPLEEAYRFYLKHMVFVNNWNLVDASAHLIVGRFLFDKDRIFLFDLTQSDNLWERRIAIVATWYFIKQSDIQTTFDLSLKLINDKHDLIHKAVGWMLREAGKKDEESLINFIKMYELKMPRTMYRYAIERLKIK